MRHLLVLSTVPTILFGLLGCSQARESIVDNSKVLQAEIVFDEVDFADGRQQVVLSMGVHQADGDALPCASMTYTVDLGWLGDTGEAELEVPGDGQRTIYDVVLEEGELVQTITLSLVEDSDTLCRAEATVWLTAGADLSGALVGEPTLRVYGDGAGLEVAGGLQAIADTE